MVEKEDTINAAVKSLGTGPAAQEAYHDLLQPAFQELGPSLRVAARLITIVLKPLSGIVWSYNKLEEWLVPNLAKKLDGLSEDEIQTPSATVAGPIMLQLPFVQDEPDLRELHANLLATSMTRQRAELAHPAYAYVIQQMSSDEARILKRVWERYGDSFSREFYLKESSVGFRPEESVDAAFKLLCQEAEVVALEHRGAYLDNLLRLKLLEEYSESESKYVPETSDDNGVYGPTVQNNYHRTIAFTNLGTNFINACVKPAAAANE